MRQRPDCPYNPSDIPCEIELDKMILEEAERESMEFFHEAQNELHCYYQRVQLLEAVLASYGLPIPPYED